MVEFEPWLEAPTVSQVTGRSLCLDGHFIRAALNHLITDQEIKYVRSVTDHSVSRSEKMVIFLEFDRHFFGYSNISGIGMSGFRIFNEHLFF